MIRIMEDNQDEEEECTEMKNRLKGTPEILLHSTWTRRVLD